MTYYYIAITILFTFLVVVGMTIYNHRNEIDLWTYGTCSGKLARRHKINKNVQMKLWKAGEQGNKEDYWHNFDRSWWHEFIPNKNIDND